MARLEGTAHRGCEEMIANAYADMIYMQSPISRRIRMDIGHRAKQFAPFAALKGFEECVRKKEIIYEKRKILSDEQKNEIDQKLRLLTYGMRIQVTFFKESQEFPGKGQYQTVEGNVDFFNPSVYLRIGDTEISIMDISDINGDIYQNLEEPC